jgi:hypothetical protein
MARLRSFAAFGRQPYADLPENRMPRHGEMTEHEQLQDEWWLGLITGLLTDFDCLHSILPKISSAVVNRRP